MRKAGIILVVLASGSARLVCETRPDVSTNLYYMSLNACLDARAAQSKNSDRTIGPDPVFVLEDQRIMLLSALFPTSVGAHRVEYFDNTALKRQFSLLHGDFPVVGIDPMNNAGSLLIVRCSDYRVRVRRGKIILGVMGGWEIQWRYDCVENKYTMVTAKRWWVQM